MILRKRAEGILDMVKKTENEILYNSSEGSGNDDPGHTVEKAKYDKGVSYLDRLWGKLYGSINIAQINDAV